MARNLTEAQFLKDIGQHKMTVLLDNGIYRSVRFARVGKDAWWNHFTITTWPWHLCISGDMGTFVFLRIEDMFEFFRSRPDQSEKLYVNLGYWAEKLVSTDRRVSHKGFDAESFKSLVLERFNEHEFESKDAKKRCLEEIKYQVLSAENEYEAHEKLGDFSEEGFEFSDSWEYDLTSYTFQYMWCCYAITWGIRQYDAGQAEAHAGTGPTTNSGRSYGCIANDVSQAYR